MSETPGPYPTTRQEDRAGDAARLDKIEERLADQLRPNHGDVYWLICRVRRLESDLLRVRSEMEQERAGRNGWGPVEPT